MDEVRIGGWRLVERPRVRLAPTLRFPLIPTYSLLFPLIVLCMPDQRNLVVDAETGAMLLAPALNEY